MEKLHLFMNSLSLLTENSWEQVKLIFSPTILKKGEFFIKEGEIAQTIGFLQNGVIRAYYETEGGKEYNKHFFTDNSFIGGYSSYITGKPNKIHQEALTDCNMLVANFDRFFHLLDSCPDIERFVRKLVESFFVQKEEREIDLVLLNATERYLNFKREYPDLDQIISQYHIASYLGVSATQLSRIRRKIVGL